MSSEAVRRIELLTEANKAANKMIGDVSTELGAIIAKKEEEIAQLLSLLRQADIAMDTAKISGVRGILAPTYQDSWVTTHTAIEDKLEEYEDGSRERQPGSGTQDDAGR